jgi:hypothetical protein
MDSFTLAGLIVSLFAIGLAFFSMWYSHQITRERLQQIAKATMALQGNQDEKALCTAIREIDPHACPLLDYTIETRNGEAVIGEWHAKSPKPDKETLRKILEKLKHQLEVSV